MSSQKTLSGLIAASLVAGSLAAVSGEEIEGLDGAKLYRTKACFSCHGADGRTPAIPSYPKIAGQHADYTYNQLRDIKSGARNNGMSPVMAGIMAGVSEEEIRAMAAWLATQ